MPRRALNAAGELTEAAWQHQVIGLARVYGFKIYHAPDGGHAPNARGRRVATGQIPEGKGFPDLLLVKGPRLIVAEFKTRTGRAGPAQTEWLDAFRQVGDALDSTVELALIVRDGDTPAAGWPSVEAYLWRPADWPDVQRVLGFGEVPRTDLDPPPAAPAPRARRRPPAT